MLTRAQRATPQICSVCSKTGTRSDFFPYQPPTSACEHPVQTCTDCLRQWFKICLATHYQPRVRCPNCPIVLIGHAELSRASTKEDYARYRYIHGRISRSSNPDWKFCLNPACDSQGQRHPPPKGGDSPLASNALMCQKCEAYSCAQCDRPWHAPLTCEEFQEKMEIHEREDSLSEFLVAKLQADGTIRQCPNCDCSIEICPSTTEFSCGRCLHSFVGNRAEEHRPMQHGKRVKGESWQDRKVTFVLPEKSAENSADKGAEMGAEKSAKKAGC